jgi:hypothetical protein
MSIRSSCVPLDAEDDLDVVDDDDECSDDDYECAFLCGAASSSITAATTTAGLATPVYPSASAQNSTMAVNQFVGHGDGTQPLFIPDHEEFAAGNEQSYHFHD